MEQNEPSQQESAEDLLEFNGQKIHKSIFTQGFVAGCDLNICGGHCCHAGVYMDKEFKHVILAHKEMILAAMNEHQVKDTALWFDEEYVDDEDFPSGVAVGSALYTDELGKDKCVFNDHRGYCSLQVAAVDNGMHKWAIKPSYCIMYPVTVFDKIVTYDDEHSIDLEYCGINRVENFTQTVFDATHEEIKYVLGEDMFNFLFEYYKANYPESFKKKETQRLFQINIPQT